MSTSGSDSNPGTVAAPFATPQRAVQAAASGDTVCLRAGAWNLTSNIIIDKPLTLKSWPGESVLLAGATADVSAVGEIIFVAASNVTIDGLEIVGGSYYGIHVNSYFLGVPPANVHITRCRIHHNGYIGIKTYQADGLVIDNSEVYAPGARTGDYSVGIDILASLPLQTDPAGSGAILRNTHVHDIPGGGVVMKAGTIRGLMESNLVERTGGPAIMAGGDSGAEFIRNAATAECINCEVRNNVVVNAGAAGIACWAARGARIANNTVVDAAASLQASLFAVPNSLGYPCSASSFLNNLVRFSSSRPAVHMANPGTGVVLDSNLYYGTAGTYSFWWESQTLTGYWSSPAAWQTGTGQDAHSIAWQDPLLDAFNTERLLPGSPAIDRGMTVPGIVADYAGVSRPQGKAFDIGAFELPAAAAVPSLLSIVSGSGQATQVGQSFGASLSARISDSVGNPVQGLPVSFFAPTSGVSGTFQGSPSAMAITGTDGVASAPVFTANQIAGSYVVTASAPSLNTVSFLLTNNQAPRPALTPTITILANGVTAHGVIPQTFWILTAVVADRTAVSEGTVQFLVNGSVIGTAPASASGVTRFPFTVPGGVRAGDSFSLRAVYLGTSKYAPSTSNDAALSIR